MDRESLLGKLRAFLRFHLYCVKRFNRNNGLKTAAALSYTTLLALVPLITIAFAVLSAFDTFQDAKETLQKELFQLMLPEAAAAVSDYLGEFVENASRMTGPGILALAVTAILLLNTITNALNEIWNATERRSFALRLLVFWALMTLGPLLIGASISLSTYAYAAVRLDQISETALPSLMVSRAITVGLSTAGFTLLFLLVPNRAVRFRHALLGALVAALLFEVLKRGFGLYITNFPAYQTIYGALAAIPIFLLWMYLSWTVLLIGAEIAAALPEWVAAEERSGSVQSPGARLSLALTLLSRMREAARKGWVMKEAALFKGLPATLEELDQVLAALRRRGFATRSGGARWVLSRDLTAVTLNDLVMTLGLSLRSGGGWPGPINQAVNSLAEAGERQGEKTIAEILDEGAEGDVGEESPPLKLSRLG